MSAEHSRPPTNNHPDFWHQERKLRHGLMAVLALWLATQAAWGLSKTNTNHQEVDRRVQPVVAPDEVYIVQDGENLGTIAEKLGTTVEELVILNALTNPDFIVPDQSLKIPGCSTHP